MPETRHSVCALDCPDACSLLIDVDEDGHGSKLARQSRASRYARVPVRQSRAIPRTGIFARTACCYPLRRTGAKGEGRFSRISWDEALDEIAGALGSVAHEHSGPESILPYSYAGTMGLLNGSGMDRRFFHRLGASRLDRTICSAAGTARG